MALTQETSSFQYKQFPWGDLIRGSKAELQDLGIAPGMAFPGEPDGKKLRVYCTDPRGFRCCIERDRWADDYYSCSIHFPGRESPEAPVEEIAQGVTMQRMWWGKLYQGRAEALVAAGLVRPDRLPGSPGLGRTVVYLDPRGQPTDRHGAHEVGGMVIKKDGPRQLYLSVHDAGMEEQNRRYEAQWQEHAAWERRMAALPRPRPLVAPSREAAAREQRQQLRLVWSRPAPTFTITP